MTRVSQVVWSFLMHVGDFLEWLFEEHKLVRRVIVLWAMWLITLVVLKFISLMTALNTETIAGVGSIIGILSTVLAFYIKSRQLDAGQNVGVDESCGN